MNIIVQTYGSNLCYCRPDTTWERENKDFYSPESINKLSFTPILFARICKAGKCIGLKFAERYYDSIGYGMLMYAENFIDIGPEGLAVASCIDHSSILPSPMYNRIVLDGQDNHYIIKANESILFDYSEGTTKMIEKAISNASSLISLRIGDYIAIELSKINDIEEIIGTETIIEGVFCNNPVFGFKIIR